MSLFFLIRLPLKWTFIGIISFVFAFSANSQTNLEKYTPSILFSKGEWELNFFNNLYSQNTSRNAKGEILNLGQQQTFINSLLQFTLGVSNDARFNLGIDLMVTNAFYGKSSTDTGIRISDGFHESALSGFGPRIKLSPIASIPYLSIQSSLLFPITDDLESPFIAHDRVTWQTQVFYDHRISQKWRAFFELGLLHRFNHPSDEFFFRIPGSVFLSYFPTGKISVYVNSQYAPRFENVSNGFEEQFGLSQWYTLVGAGTKYQVLPSLGLELSYANFISSRNDGAGFTVNLGVRYIRR